MAFDARTATIALLLAAGSVARADPPSAADSAALFELPPSRRTAPLDCGTQCVFEVDPMDPFAPAAITTHLDARWLADLPESDATHDRLATYAAGAARDGLGLYVPGASSIEDRWLVDGAPADDVRTERAGTRVPLAFLASIDVTTGGFAARDRASTGAVVDAELRRGGAQREVHAAVWLTAGTPARALASATYVPVTGAIGDTRAATAVVSADGPIGTIAGGRAWYVAGVQARLAPVTYTGTARREVDRDGDGLPDRDAGGLVLDPLAARGATTLSLDVPFVARAGWTRGPHDLALTLVGDWSRDTSFAPMATLAAGGVDHLRAAGDAIATWRGRWARTRALVQWAWHRDDARDRAHDPAAAAIPQIATAFVPGGALLPDDFALGVGCDDAAAEDPYPTITNCPMPTGYFARGGAGALTHTTGDRPSVTASLAHVWGEHAVEAGVTGEDARLVVRRSFTGGYLERSIFGVDRIDTRWVALGGGDQTCSDDGATRCAFLDEADTTYRVRSAAAWLEDTWRPAPAAAVDAGLRWEWTHVGGADPLHQLEPRVGAAWDPLGGGRSRVFAGFARTMPMLPGALAETIAGGPTQLTTVVIPAGQSEFLNETPGVRLAAGTSAMVIDDVTAGGEVALGGALRAGVTGEWRVLRRALDGDGTLISNPPAHRDAGALTIQLATTGTVAFRVAYTYARAVGDWTGPADPALGATYYHGVDFAGAPPIGDLPSDFGHRFLAEVVTTRRIGRYDLIAGGRAIAASGRPIGAVDGAGGVVLARGLLGRTPPMTTADLHVALRRAGVEVGLDLLDAFDHRGIAAVDERYTPDRAAAIVGGGPADLVFLRADDGSIATRDPDFGRPSAYLAPLTAILYARAAF